MSSAALRLTTSFHCFSLGLACSMRTKMRTTHNAHKNNSNTKEHTEKYVTRFLKNQKNKLKHGTVITCCCVIVFVQSILGDSPHRIRYA